MKAKADSGIHLLDAARALRVERDKERDLALQEEQEKEIISRLQVTEGHPLLEQGSKREQCQGIS